MVRRMLFAAALGGAVAGLLDIAMAAGIYQTSLDTVMRAIARGLIGQSAMEGGSATALLGLVLQLAMGALIGLIYGVISLWAPILRRHWKTCGALYGVGVFFVMNWVVVPLSAARTQPKFTLLIGAANLLAMIVFSLVIAASARRGSDLSRRKAPSSQPASRPA